MKKQVLKFLVEMIPVMIGVYLGFALNNFGERQQLNRQSDTYKNMLVQEIKENHENLKRVNPYHVQLKEDFEEILKEEDALQAFMAYSFKGLRPGFVNESAFETGIQTGIIQEFDLKLIQSLNKLYKLQNQYEDFNEMMLNSFMSKKLPETDKEMRNTITLLLMNMNDILNYERELIISYEYIEKEF